MWKLIGKKIFTILLYRATQSVASPTADLRVASLILARSHTFMEIDHEIIPSTDSRRVVVYVHNVLVNPFKSSLSGKKCG